MPASAVYTFSDPDEYASRIIAKSTELTVSKPGQFSAKLIQIRYVVLLMLTGGSFAVAALVVLVVMLAVLLRSDRRAGVTSSAEMIAGREIYKIRAGLPTAASGGNISPERPVVWWMSARGRGRSP